MIVIELDKIPTCCLACRFYYLNDENTILYKESKKNEEKNCSFRCMADLKIRRATLEEMSKRPEDCPVKVIRRKQK